MNKYIQVLEINPSVLIMIPRIMQRKEAPANAFEFEYCFKDINIIIKIANKIIIKNQPALTF